MVSDRSLPGLVVHPRQPRLSVSDALDRPHPPGNWTHTNIVEVAVRRVRTDKLRSNVLVILEAAPGRGVLQQRPGTGATVVDDRDLRKSLALPHAGPLGSDHDERVGAERR